MAQAVATTVPKKKGWFSKIPNHVLLSPAGLVLLLYALIMEIIDFIPLEILDNLWELPLEIGFIVLLSVLAKTPLKTAIVPLLIERIPFLNLVLPTWVIRLLA